MNILSFLKLVEIQTKVASTIPFLLGTIYTIYRYNSFSLKNFIIMAVSLISFDMVTTTINNYIDYLQANKKRGYNYEIHNAIVSYDIKETTVKIIITILLALAIVFGIILYINTDLVVLVLGIISFGVGVLYTFGPIPISRMPLGEIFSGLFMGFIITFISVYIHIYNSDIAFIVYENGIVNIKFDIIEIVILFLVSLPAVLGISNIMLANNICDIEDDIENKRYTLPIYIGKNKALKLFKWLYYIIFIDIITLLIIQVLPIISLLVILVVIPVNKHINIFFTKQTKEETFIISVKNFILINISYILTISIGALLYSLQL